VRALIVEQDQVLLIRTHGSQKWSMPGGGVKRGESLRAAAEREACEETGCKVASERMLGIYINVHEGMTNHVAVFVCRALTPPTDALNLEIAEARYWPIDALPSTVSSGLRRRLDEYANGMSGIDQQW
jgi:ADP-ribose pyrophosphatase YjhB (NUDIX family)